jgi:hypothetical protein
MILTRPLDPFSRGRSRYLARSGVIDRSIQEVTSRLHAFLYPCHLRPLNGHLECRPGRAWIFDVYGARHVSGTGVPGAASSGGGGWLRSETRPYLTHGRPTGTNRPSRGPAPRSPGPDGTPPRHRADPPTAVGGPPARPRSGTASPGFLPSPTWRVGIVYTREFVRILPHPGVASATTMCGRSGRPRSAGATPPAGGAAGRPRAAPRRRWPRLRSGDRRGCDRACAAVSWGRAARHPWTSGHRARGVSDMRPMCNG